MKEKSGIYVIRQIATRNAYIGSSSKLSTRFGQHKSLLRAGKHHSPYLQNAWNKYGEGAFVFEILEECPKENLIEREQYYIDLLGGVFNVGKVAGTRRGVPQSPETIEKVRQAHLGKKRSDETKQRIRDAQKGKPHPWAVGHPVSEETRAKISAGNKGKSRGSVLSPQARAANPASKKGVAHPWAVGHPVSDETRAKIAERLKGNTNGKHRKITDELREKIRQSNLGRKYSPEARENMRKARFAFLDRLRGK